MIIESRCAVGSRSADRFRKRGLMKAPLNGSLQKQQNSGHAALQVAALTGFVTHNISYKIACYHLLDSIRKNGQIQLLSKTALLPILMPFKKTSTHFQKLKKFLGQKFARSEYDRVYLGVPQERNGKKWTS
jgi:hypothetical protein